MSNKQIVKDQPLYHGLTIAGQEQEDVACTHIQFEDALK